MTYNVPNPGAGLGEVVAPCRQREAQEASLSLWRHQSPALAGCVARITMTVRRRLGDRRMRMLPQPGHMSARAFGFAFRGAGAVSALAADVLPTWHDPPFHASLPLECTRSARIVLQVNPGSWPLSRPLLGSADGRRVQEGRDRRDRRQRRHRGHQVRRGRITGSSAMISEGIHSLVDTGNGGLLFHGLRRAPGRPTTTPLRSRHGTVLLEPHRRHQHLRHRRRHVDLRGHRPHPAPVAPREPPHQLHRPGCGDGLRGGSRSRRLRAFRQTRKRQTSRRRAPRQGPSLFTVVFEDSAALFGLVVAFLGVCSAICSTHPVWTARRRSPSG